MVDPLLNLFLGIAPERKDELLSLWDSYGPEIKLEEDSDSQGEPQIYMEAGLYKFVRFNHRTVRLFWISAFIVNEGQKQVEQAIVNNDWKDFHRFIELVEFFKTTMSSNDYLNLPMPLDIPQPGEYKNYEDAPELRAVEDLATFSAGWAFLHEMKHIIHQQDGTGAPNNGTLEEYHKEEASCDEFATNFMLEKTDIYSTKANEPLQEVLKKGIWEY